MLLASRRAAASDNDRRAAAKAAAREAAARRAEADALRDGEGRGLEAGEAPLHPAAAKQRWLEEMKVAREGGAAAAERHVVTSTPEPNGAAETGMAMPNPVEERRRWLERMARERIGS